MRKTFRSFHFQRNQDIKIAIDQVALAMISFDGRGRPKGCEVIQRSPRTARVESLRCTGEKAEQICFRETVKIDDEIKLSSPNVFNQTENTSDRKGFEAVAQSDAVNNQRLVRITGQVNNFGAGLSHGDSDTGSWESFPDRLQGRQAQHDVAELTKIDNQNVARIKHFLNYYESTLGFWSAPAWRRFGPDAGHLHLNWLKAAREIGALPCSGPKRRQAVVLQTKRRFQTKCRTPISAAC